MAARAHFRFRANRRDTPVRQYRLRLRRRDHPGRRSRHARAAQGQPGRATVSDPERFDPYRSRNPHLTFGHGPRFCVGAPLARIELRSLFPALLERFPTLRLAVPLESLRSRDEFLTGGLVELPVI